MGPDSRSSEDERPLSIDIHAGEERARPLYADLAQVRHDLEGFLIDFYMVEPDNKDMGWLTVRVRLGHRMMIRLSQAINENIAKWAAKEVKVREAESDLLEKLSHRSEAVEVVDLLDALTQSVRESTKTDQAKEA